MLGVVMIVIGAISTSVGLISREILIRRLLSVMELSRHEIILMLDTKQSTYSRAWKWLNKIPVYGGLMLVIAGLVMAGGGIGR